MPVMDQDAKEIIFRYWTGAIYDAAHAKTQKTKAEFTGVLRTYASSVSAIIEAEESKGKLIQPKSWFDGEKWLEDRLRASDLHGTKSMFEGLRRDGIIQATLGSSDFMVDRSSPGA